MTSERKAQLVAAIKAAYPSITVRTSWTMADWDHVGIQLHSRDAATGNTLCADRSDAKLDGMTDDEVMQWASQCIADHMGRQKQTRRRVAVERQMDRE